MPGDEGVLARLERWSPGLFLSGGAIVVGFTIIQALPTFTASSFPIVRNVLTVGYVLAFIGLIGQYPSLSTTQKWTARVGAVAALLGAVGFSFNVLASLGQLGGLIPHDAAWTTAFVPFGVIGMVVGFITTGVAGLRSTSHSTQLSLLILVPGLVFLLLFVGLATVGLDQWGFVFSGVEALAILGIGYLLRTERPTYP